MAIPQTILDYLQEHCVTYSSDRAATEPAVRSSAAKTMIFRVDNQLLMAVLNADRNVDFDAIKKIVGCDELGIVSEKELCERFGPCDPAAIPPFGTLFRMPLYCDRTLAQEPEIEFQAGTASDVIRMAFSEFVQIEAPTMADFSSPSGSTTRVA